MGILQLQHMKLPESLALEVQHTVPDSVEAKVLLFLLVAAFVD